MWISERAELLEVARREYEQAGDEGRGQGREHRRKQPARAPAIEAGEAEAAAVELAEDQAGDQVAADDEEDVDADEAAAKARDAGVEEEDRQNRDGAQAVHLRAGRRRPRPPAGIVAGGAKGSGMVGGMIPDPTPIRLCKDLRPTWPTLGPATTPATNPMTSHRSSPVALVALLLGLAFSAFYAGTEPRRLRLRRRHPDVPGDRGDLGARRGRGHLARADARTSRTLPRVVEGRRYAKYGLGPRSSRCRSMARATASSTVWSSPRRRRLRQSAHRSDDLRHRPRQRRHRRSDRRRHLPARGRARLSAARRPRHRLLPGSDDSAGALRQHFPVGTALGTLPGGRLLGLLKAKGKGSVKGVVAGRWWLAISGFAAGLAVATKVAHVVVVLPLFFWVAVLGWRRSRHRGLVAHTLYWSLFFFAWLGAIAAYNWSRFGSVFETGYGKEAGNFTAAFAVGFAGLLASPAKGDPLVLPGAVSFAARRAGLLAAGSRLRAGDSRGERALAAADLALLPVVRRRQLGAAFPGAAAAAVDPARGGDLLPFGGGGAAGGRRSSCWSPPASSYRWLRCWCRSAISTRRSPCRGPSFAQARLAAAGLAPAAGSRAGCRRPLSRRLRSSWGEVRSVRPGSLGRGRGSPTSPSSTTARTPCSSGRAAASWSRRWRSCSLCGSPGRGAAARRGLRRRCCRARRSSSRPR